jgi:uridine kinase
MKRRLITVDGRDGTGKTLWAEAFAERCRERGLGTCVLHVDDVRRPIDSDAPGADEAALYYDAYYDLPALQRCVEAYLAGAARCELTVFDGNTETLGETRAFELQRVAVLIVEGVLVLRLPAAEHAFHVHLQSDPHEARRRVSARDQARGRAPAEIDRRITRRYGPAQARYEREHRPAQRADLLLDTTDPQAPRVLRRGGDARILRLL